MIDPSTRCLRAPLWEAVNKYRQEKNILLHMPGHKGGRGFPDDALRAAGSLDYTEVPGLDDLHCPEGPLREAQRLAAEAWGAAESLFLINGATSGIQALLMAFKEGDAVLIPRNAHRSFLGGMILSGVRPIYLECQVDKDTGIAVSVTPQEIKQKIEQHPEAKAVFLVSPTFYGTVNDIASIKSSLPEGLPLLVDEAHGGHFAFHPGYPAPALKHGAAACVQGLHKTLPVLTQAGILHMQENFCLRDRVRAAWDFLTSTSPSFPLMVSLDLGRAIMERDGRRLLEQARQCSVKCRERINRTPGLRTRGPDLVGTSGVADFDPLKVLVEIDGVSLSGEEMGEILRRKYAVQVELARGNHILAMFSPFSRPEDWEQLSTALEKIASEYHGGSRALALEEPPGIPPQVLTPREAFFAGQKSVNIKEAGGQISAEVVAPYPPGIPCLMPGELITEEVRDYLIFLRERRTAVHGPRDQSLRQIRVVEHA